ncbi:MAG: translesion DNA synthesis-associated protein ImuA [Pseudomonadales bacterium]|nr:translesion DNA synthesis-associated protein ImuA [Pseudomonadales bacterium]
MNRTDLHTLLQHPHLWRASDAPATRGQHLGRYGSSGYVVLDELLCNGNTQGGWPHSSTCELLSHQTGIGELRLLMPSLVQACNENRWITWIAPPFIPYAPALHAQGLNLNKLLIIHSKTLKDSLWATEQCLQSGACSAVLAWPQGANYKQLRRLQVAAKAGKSRGIFFRTAQAAQHASPIPLRIRLARKSTFMLKIIKRPGGWASQTIHIPLIDEDDLTQPTMLQESLSQRSLPQQDKSDISSSETLPSTVQTQTLQARIPASKGGVYVVDVSPLS